MKICKKSFAYDRHVVRRGVRVDDNDPRVDISPDSFADVADEAPVERATAKPGEKRTTKRTKNTED